MKKKPVSILELEKRLKVDIFYIPFEELMRNATLVNIRTYSTDKNGNVILLKLYDCPVKPQWLESFKHLTQLTLLNCGLADISFTEPFTKLRTLDISFNQIEDISPLRNLDNLKAIDVSFNKIFDLSPVYTQMARPEFEHMQAAGNPLIYPSPETEGNGVTAMLEWFNEQLDKAREVIRACAIERSSTIKLGNLGITDLSLLPELFSCTHLREIDFSNDIENETHAAIPNNIFHIPNKINQLTNLTSIIADGRWKKDGQLHTSRIRSLAPFEKLKNLQLIDVAHNQITGNVNLTSLKKLKIFSASNNMITDVSSHYILKNLTDVLLSDNNLQAADFLKKMPNATRIDLSFNLISNLYEVRDIVMKKGIVDGGWDGKGINIAGNPLDVPNHQVVSQGMEAVARFFQQYEAERSVRIPLYKNDDIKIVLAGNSDAGKSSLAERLINEKWNDQLPTTHWMEIKRWQPVRNKRKYNIRMFDFGGQEYYHDTHYLFFSSNTAYVLLWNSRTNNYDACEIHQLQKDQSKVKIAIQGFPIPYWLESIEYHTHRKPAAKEKLNSLHTKPADQELSQEEYEKMTFNSKPEFILTSNNVWLDMKRPPNILVTQNKIESAFSNHFLDQEQLKIKHPAIFDFANISAKTGRGMEHFKDLLFEMIDNLPIAERECLGTWGAIKQEIEAGVQDSDKEMTLAKFRLFCNDIISRMPEVKNAGLKSTDALWFSNADTESYARYLNDIGLILYFPDNEHLKDKVFVNQDYVLKKIYDILEGLHGLNGKFGEAHILAALGKTSIDEECNTIIELMKHFKIVFPHPSLKGAYIAPLYLPARPSKSIGIFLDDGHQPTYSFQFKGFIHKHIILEFFHRYGQHALKDEQGQQYYYWKNGIVIKDEHSAGIVMVRFNNATTSRPAHIDVFSMNKNGDKTFLKKITDELERLCADMNVEKTVTVDGENFVPIKKLLAAEAANQWVFQHEGKYFDLKLFRAHLKNELKMKKIFISYSKADADYLQQLENHLSALKRNGSISTWNCRQLLPGEKWDRKIKDELNEADIILFLVSSDFLATDYIWDIEIERAIERENTDPNVKVVPIIIRSCVWEDTPLSVYNTAPKKALVLNTAKDIDSAFADTVRDLKKIL